MPAPPAPDPPDADAGLELLLSRLLRAGVLASMGILLAGIAVGFVHHPQRLLDRDGLAPLIAPGSRFPHTVPQVIDGFDDFAAPAVIASGLLVLLATPILRVAVSLGGFARRRDWTYVALTGYVLAVLLVSFLLGRAG